jgi:hypothetical protein
VHAYVTLLAVGVAGDCAILTDVRDGHSVCRGRVDVGRGRHLCGYVVVDDARWCQVPSCDVVVVVCTACNAGTASVRGGACVGMTSNELFVRACR